MKYAGNIPDFVQFERKEDEWTLVLNDWLFGQPSKVVRGAICVGLSHIAHQGKNLPPSLLQIDAFTRGFPREIAAYVSFLESEGKLGKSLTSGQLIEIVRQSETILRENLCNPLYSNRDDYVPHRRD